MRRARSKDDLSESNDLAESMPTRAEELRAMLRDWRDQVNAQMPQLNPAYDPKRLDEWWSRGTVQPTRAPGMYQPQR